MTHTLRYLFVLGLFAASTHAAQRPNFIVITAGDIGRDWIHCYGGAHPTPNIDRLAQQGVLYETAWSTPAATSSHVTLLTGQYPFRHGWIRDYDVPKSGGIGLNPLRFTTWARILRDAGYRTALGGQWQLNNLRRHPKTLPAHGFQEHCVWLGAAGRPGDPDNRAGNAQLLKNGQQTTVRNGAEAIHAFLVDFIRRHEREPFLIYYPMLTAAEPPSGPSRNRPQPPASAAGEFAAKVTYVDDLIGRLVSVVDQAGLQQNTLILLTGTNGSAVAGNLQGKQYPAGKGHASDRGVHVPWIVRAPFLTDGNRRSRDLVDATDLFPTLLQLAQVKSPQGWLLDGKSGVASLQGSEDPFEKRNWIYSQSGNVRLLRDWQHIVDSVGSFHDLPKDPLQQHPVSPQDKIAPGRRQRLQMILKRFPPDAAAPFPEFADAP